MYLMNFVYPTVSYLDTDGKTGTCTCLGRCIKTKWIYGACYSKLSLLRNFVREEVSVVYCCKLLSKRVREGLGWGFSLPLRPWLDYMLMWLVHNTLYILLRSCSWGALQQRTVIILPFSFFTFSFTLKKLLVRQRKNRDRFQGKKLF